MDGACAPVALKKKNKADQFRSKPPGLGAIEPWLRSRGHHLTYTEFFRNEPVPSIDSFDGLIVMGGPMGANDDGDLPWLTA